MKRKVSVVLISLTICCVLAACFGPKKKYPSGKDTAYSFGDGTFQFVRSSKKKTMSIVVGGGGSLMRLYDFREIRSNVYVVGYQSTRNGKCVMVGIIDSKSNTMRLCIFPDEAGYVDKVSDTIMEYGVITILPDISPFTEEEQSILTEILNNQSLG